MGVTTGARQIEMGIRISVFLIYLAYLVVIVIALTSSLLPVRWTVMVCLIIHFVGLLIGLFVTKVYELPPWYDIYPKALGEMRGPIIAWDFIQAIFLVLLASGAAESVYHIAAAVAIIGIGGCFYKMYTVYNLMKCPDAKEPCHTCKKGKCLPGCCQCHDDCECRVDTTIVKPLITDETIAALRL